MLLLFYFYKYDNKLINIVLINATNNVKFKKYIVEFNYSVMTQRPYVNLLLLRHKTNLSHKNDNIAYTELRSMPPQAGRMYYHMVDSLRKNEVLAPTARRPIPSLVGCLLSTTPITH